MNAINVIAPYKHHGQWVFDDPRVGLLQDWSLFGLVDGQFALKMPMVRKGRILRNRRHERRQRR
jgi:hypothetical protein